MQKTIEQLKSEEAELKRKLKENSEAQRKIYSEEFLTKYGLKIGDRVIVNMFVTKFEAQISGIEHNENNTVRNIILRHIKNDGSVGKRQTTLYSTWVKNYIQKI